MIDIGPIGACVATVSPSAQALLALSLGILAVPFMLWLARNQRFPGQRALVIAHVGVEWWLLMTAFELAVPDAPCKILASGLSHAGIGLVPIAWISFVYRFTVGSSSLIRKVQNILMVVVPLLGSGMALTSGSHGLFYTPQTQLLQGAYGPYILYDHGPLFYAQSALLYACIIGALVLLFRAASTAQTSGQLRYWLLFTLATVPTIGNAGYIVFEFTFWGIDPTPFLFAITLIIYVFMLISDSTLDLGALARRQVFNNLPQAIFVVAAGRQIIGGNPAAQALLQDRIEAVGTAAKAELEIRSLFLKCLESGPLRWASVALGDRFYDIDLQLIEPAVGRGQPPLGWVMIASDVTAAARLQQYYYEQQKSQPPMRNGTR